MHRDLILRQFKHLRITSRSAVVQPVVALPPPPVPTTHATLFAKGLRLLSSCDCGKSRSWAAAGSLELIMCCGVVERMHTGRWFNGMPVDLISGSYYGGVRYRRHRHGVLPP
jgi:hypothetical protein